MDPPHDITGVLCSECHDFTQWTFPFNIPLLGGGTPEEEYQVLCRNCHTGNDVPGEGQLMVTHSGATTSNTYFGGDWFVSCSVCHDQHTQPLVKVVGANGGFINSKIDLRRIQIAGADHDPRKIGNKSIKLLNLVGPNSFADGDATIDGICEVCHTQTNHWRNDGSLAGQGAHIGLKGSNCTNCHPHNQGFGGVHYPCFGCKVICRLPVAGHITAQNIYGM
jgi:hypothetical protein